MTWRAFIEVFRFLKRRRERLNAERHAERDHQFRMLEKFGQMLLEQTKASHEPILEIAKAMQANASVQHEWLKGFQVPADAGATASLPVVPDEGEWEFDALTKAALGQQVPPEFKLAFDLDHGDSEAQG